jgi:SAM-dependent methyltransferase
MAGKEIWNKVYKSDNSFFGEEPSNFALLCLPYENKQQQCKDTIFFASNGMEVEALDYSVIAVEILDKIAKEKRLAIKSLIFDVKKNSLPFPDSYFDAVYSHMLFNMRFSQDELHFVFSEIRRVLKPKGWNFLSVRNHHDKSYGKGQEIEKGIYDINGFQIRFFTQKEIEDLAESEGL